MDGWANEVQRAPSVHFRGIRWLAPAAHRTAKAERCSGAADAYAAGAAILARVAAAFEGRLDAASTAPLAVGFSGGGDSLALLLAACAWARPRNRPVVALTVDHGLNAQSRAWTRHAARIAAAIGVGFRALAWDGGKPATGLQAAARRARHALLAGAAREAGASVVLLGHTRDDRSEAAWMRAQGSSVGDPREWSPSPAWPEGRGIFLLRPLLNLGRAELRELLAPSGLDWIEDPANQDSRHLRALARMAGAGLPPPAADPAVDGEFRVDDAGSVRLARDASPRLLAIACVCAGGGERLPRRESVDRLRVRLAAGERFTATLAGARIEAGQEVMIGRDPGRLETLATTLSPSGPTVFDGRFELIVHREGLKLQPLGGLLSRMEKQSRLQLGAFSPSARRTLPALVEADGTVTCPILAQSAWASARSLVRGRLEAACGRIARESPLTARSHGGQGPGVLS